MIYQVNSVRWERSCNAAIVLAAALLLVGCGSSDKGQVSGTVTAARQPVTGGSVSFAPVAGSAAGRVATGAVRSEGSFSLSTDVDNDGALIGRHKGGLHAPIGRRRIGRPRREIALPRPGAREREVEVKAGENKFAIELIPAATGTVTRFKC